MFAFRNVQGACSPTPNSFLVQIFSDRTRLRLRASAQALARQRISVVGVRAALSLQRPPDAIAFRGRKATLNLKARAELENGLDPPATATPSGSLAKPQRSTPRPPAERNRPKGCSRLDQELREDVMRVVFDTKTLATAQRGEAWREAICEIYLQVDCIAERQKNYTGFVREARFGTVTLTDTLCSAQSVHRRAHHTAHFDKDCYYFGIEHLGEVNITQAGLSFPLRIGSGTLYYANEPYNLRCYVKSRQFWAELPRKAFDRRFELRPTAAPHLGRPQQRPGPHCRRILLLARAGEHLRRREVPRAARRATHGHLGVGFGRRAWPTIRGRKVRPTYAPGFDQELHRIKSPRPEFVA